MRDTAKLLHRVLAERKVGANEIRVMSLFDAAIEALDEIDQIVSVMLPNAREAKDLEKTIKNLTSMKDSIQTKFDSEA